MKKLVLVMFIFSSLGLQSESDSLKSTYGFYINFLLNLHDADFSRIPDCPSCSPGFRTGLGFGPAFGLLYEYPLKRNYSIGARASFQNISGLLKASEITTVIVNSQDVTGEFEHTIDGSLTIAGLEPYFLYKLNDNISLSLGLNFSTLISKDYSQKEQIVRPANIGTFVDENGNDTFSRTRNEFSGELQAASSIFIAPVIGVSYKFPLNNKGTWNAHPELSYQLGITNIVDDPLVNRWTVNSLRAGIAIKYTPEYRKPKIRQYEKIEKIDTLYLENELITSNQFKSGQALLTKSVDENDDFIIETEKIFRTDTIFSPRSYALSATISAVGLTDDFEEVPKPKFVIEEFSTSRLQPLLNYIFFDSLSSEINPRYSQLSKNEVSRFSMDSLFDSDVISTYHQLLNIIGKRMIEFPEANITLIGCNDGLIEKDYGDLSALRAESIKKYLTEIWNISDSRIMITAQNLPEKASTPITDHEKAQENRRVEINSNNPEITKPVFATYNFRTTSIPGIRFKPDINSEAGLKSWEIDVTQDNFTLKRFNFGEGFMESVDWMLDEDKRSIPVLDKPLEFTLTAYDIKSNKAVSDKGIIEIEQITVQKKRTSGVADKQIDNYSLILFDFDKSDISFNNKEIIGFVKSRLNADSKVEITGYTDRTGDDTYNKRLSERRASTVNGELKHKGSTFKGIGKEILLYDNDFPEGRFYCRTVNIRVENEIK